jgi:hypothetical protein
MARSFEPLPEQQGSISIKLYKRACSPGANVVAVWYRLLCIVKLLRQQGHLSAWLNPPLFNAHGTIGTNPSARRVETSFST